MVIPLEAWFIHNPLGNPISFEVEITADVRE